MKRCIIPRRPCDHCPQVVVSGTEESKQPATQANPPAAKEEGIPWGALIVGTGIVVGLAYLFSPNMKITPFRPKTSDAPETPPPMPAPTAT